MNRDIAEKWIADLRANPPQAKGRLFDGKGYCCLGRLCILAGLKPRFRPIDESYIFNTDRFNLPHEVMAWAEMNSSEGFYNYRRNNIARDNDSGKTFAEIADIIEAHIDEL